MDREQCCRLCIAPNTYDHLNIFSDIGIEMKMRKIISIHFKCEVSELDPLPNLICQTCWKTTESFHELYQKSKTVEETFLNPAIKVEPDEIELVPGHQETNFVEELQLEDDLIKPELELDDSDANDDVEMGYDANTMDSDEQSDDDDDKGSGDDENDPDFKCSEDEEAKGRKTNSITATEVPAAKKKKKSRKAMRQSKAERDKKFDEFLCEHKHRLKMDCDLCSTVFENLQEARDHYAKQHNTTGYLKCCSAKLYFPFHVVDHINHHLDPKSSKPKHKPKEFSCNICSKSLTSKRKFIAHTKVHEENDEAENDEYLKFMNEHFDMKCDFCDTIFRGFYDASEHYKEFHSNVEKRGYVKCCNTKLRTKNLVIDHIKSHLEPEIFKCDVCKKTFTTQQKLAKHKYRHYLTKSKSFICDYCNRACRDKDQLKKHMFARHVFIEKKYECEICHKKFQIPILLKNHMYAAHREKKCVGTCEICGKSFYTNYALEKHKIQHIDKSERLIKSTQCKYCFEWIATKSGVFYHKQKHESGPQTCEHCRLELPNRVSYLTHIRHYHRAHKYTCSYCSKTFPIESLLKKHEESHTKHKTYPCLFCPKIFSVSTSLSTHMGRDHPQERERLRIMRKMKGVPSANKDE